jgi:hypothetical protein
VHTKVRTPATPGKIGITNTTYPLPNNPLSSPLLPENIHKRYFLKIAAALVFIAKYLVAHAFFPVG